VVGFAASAAMRGLGDGSAAATDTTAHNDTIIASLRISAS
jgi:hypothetical protein